MCSEAENFFDSLEINNITKENVNNIIEKYDEFLDKQFSFKLHNCGVFRTLSFLHKELGILKKFCSIMYTETIDESSLEPKISQLLNENLNIDIEVAAVCDEYGEICLDKYFDLLDKKFRKASFENAHKIIQLFNKEITALIEFHSTDNRLKKYQEQLNDTIHELDKQSPA